MPKTLRVMGFAAGLLAGTTLMVAAQMTNRLGPGGAALVPGGNGVLGAGDVAVGNWAAGTNPGVNRNLSGYTLRGFQRLRQLLVARGARPPPGVSR
jgi:hypothetical protein